MHLDATEHRDGIVFLHAVKEGPASRSYGLAVAQLAGVPREVIAAAREYLGALEKGGGAQTRRHHSQPALARARNTGAHSAGPTTSRTAHAATARIRACSNSRRH